MRLCGKKKLTLDRAGMLAFSLVGLFFCVTFMGCLQEGSLKRDFDGFTPTSLNDGWEVSSPAQEGLDSARLGTVYRLLYSEERFPMARSFLVVRHGKLIAEAYPRDAADRDRYDNIQSCTKTFTSILTGIALTRGDIDSLGQPLADFYPERFEAYPEKANITLEHALSMKVGLDFDNSKETLELYRGLGHSVDFVLSRKRLYSPGTVMHYNDGAPQLVSAAIAAAAGKPLSAYASEHLFAPLSITDWKWEAAADGTTFGAFSLFLKPRDMAKVGQMLLQNGVWKGERILDSAYIAKATQPQATGNFNGAPYGLYFWLFPAWGAYAAEGHGGQILMVLPRSDMVIVYTAWPYTSSLLWDEYPELVDGVLAAIE